MLIFYSQDGSRLRYVLYLAEMDFETFLNTLGLAPGNADRKMLEAIYFGAEEFSSRAAGIVCSCFPSVSARWLQSGAGPIIAAGHKKVH